ncbi:MAG TPA: hypothetical protein VGD07_04305 [Methylomirabilota bacterium]
MPQLPLQRLAQRTDHCREMDRRIDQRSQELDRWRHEHFTPWPYVKNLPPDDSLHNYACMQEVWLDR